MTTTFKKEPKTLHKEPKVLRNEDLKLVPAGTKCIKCFKKISQGIFQDGFSIGLFLCKECHLKNSKK